MKIRSNFVSNSSSSSFILIFKKLPETKGQLYDLMFPNGEEVVGHWDYKVSTMSIVNEVFNDIEKEIDPTREELEVLLSSTQIEDEMSLFEETVPEYDYHRWKEPNYWEDLKKQQDEVGKRHTDKLLEDNKGKIFRVVEYEDHSELGSIIEHGDVFSYGNLKAIRIGNH